MPGTVGPFNGTSLLVYAAGTAIAYSTSCTLNANIAMIDITTKGSGGDTDNLPGLRDWSVDVEGLVALDSTYNAETIDGYRTGRTKVMLKFSTNTSSDGYWHGYAYLTSFSMSAPMEDKVTFSASFTGTDSLSLSQKT
jgi:TP901-1 family phage major tail protein